MIDRGEALDKTLAAMTAQSQLARWYDGEDVYVAAQDPAIARLESIAAADGQPSPTTEAPRALQALKAHQLADLAGMSERGALKRIVHGFHRGLPGFYRDGRRWFAEPAAFAQFRMSSDCAGSDTVQP